MANKITPWITQKALLGNDDDDIDDDNDNNNNNNLPVVLRGYQTWSLTLGEEHTLRVFENRLLRKILGSKRNSK